MIDRIGVVSLRETVAFRTAQTPISTPIESATYQHICNRVYRTAPSGLKAYVIAMVGLAVVLAIVMVIVLYPA